MSKKVIVDEIHKSVRKNFIRRATVIKGIDDLWQADLIDIQKFAHCNKGHKYILIVIDALSKFAWAVPIKQKTKDEVAQSMLMIIKKSGRKPSNLQTDLGKEFYNCSFNVLMKDYKINHYSTFSTKKASIVERLIRTIKNKLYKIFSLKGSYVWFGNNLDSVVKTYNNSVHRSTKFRPNCVNKSNESIVLDNIHNSQKYKKIQKPKYKIGDQVRISKYKGDFGKGYTPNWSTEIFNVVKVRNTNPVTYHIEDKHGDKILGAFYEQELQKTKCPTTYLIEKIIKRKGNKIYVKWLGLSDNENSWINKNALVQ